MHYIASDCVTLFDAKAWNDLFLMRDVSKSDLLQLLFYPSKYFSILYLLFWNSTLDPT